MNGTKKLKMVMTALEISQIELARLTNQSQANLSKKMTTNNFRINEYEEILAALGCKLEMRIILPDGEIL